MFPSVAEVLLQSIAPEVLAEHRRREAERIETTAISASVYAVAEQTAAAFDLPYDDVLHHVLTLPRNALDLLSTPQGWALISQHVAMQLLGEPAHFVPVVH